MAEDQKGWYKILDLRLNIYINTYTISYIIYMNTYKWIAIPNYVVDF